MNLHFYWNRLGFLWISFFFQGFIQCQKPPPKVLKISQIHKKTPVLESLFNKVAGQNETPKQLLPVNIVKVLRTSFFKNIGERMLLYTAFLSNTFTEVYVRHYQL